MNTTHPYIQKAIQAFASGRVVAMPTETVYGLAAPVDRPELIKKIFTIKQRPTTDPLIVHVSDWNMAQAYVNKFPNYVHALVQAYWPGPLTLLLPKSKSVDPLITAGSDWVALRMPDHPWALAIIEAVGCGLVAPSANPFQKVSPTTAADVSAYFSTQDVEVIDGGPCTVGIESTLVRLEHKQLTVIRKGMITASMLASTLEQQDVTVIDSQGVEVAPGQDPNHYQPTLPLVLCIKQLSPEQMQAQTKSSFHLHQGCEIVLPRDTQAAAQALYQLLRTPAPQADHLWVDVSWVDVHDEQWKAILDRLTRASTHIIE